MSNSAQQDKSLQKKMLTLCKGSVLCIFTVSMLTIVIRSSITMHDETGKTFEILKNLPIFIILCMLYIKVQSCSSFETFEYNLKIFILSMQTTLLLLFLKGILTGDQLLYLRCFYKVNCYTYLLMACKFNIESKLNHQIHNYLIVVNLIMVAFMAIFYSLDEIREEAYVALFLSFQTRSTLNMSLIYTQLFNKTSIKNKINLERYENIFNNIKSSFISVNLTKLDVSYNNGFQTLVKHIDKISLSTGFFENTPSDLTKFMEANENSFEFKSFLKEYGLFDKFNEEHNGSQKYTIRKMKFFKQVFYLIKILKCLQNKDNAETDLSICFKCNHFEKNQKFGYLGNFVVDNTKDDSMYYEFTYRKSIIQEVEIIDIMLNDITEICQIEEVKADNKYRKSYLSNVAHEFKAPIQILLITVNELSKFTFPKEAEQLIISIIRISM